MNKRDINRQKEYIRKRCIYNVISPLIYPLYLLIDKYLEFIYFYFPADK